MGDPAEKLPRRATYADLEAVPTHRVAEIIEGVLHTFPRPAPRHARAAGRLGAKLDGPFDEGHDGPGGWIILPEPELHFGPEDDKGVLVPDLAGWRRERLPRLPDEAFFRLAPDWVCEVLSPSTEAHDREKKMAVYAREGVRHAWLIDPLVRTLEVFALGEKGKWVLSAVYSDAALVRAEPFEALELELARLWAE